jgi:uncharacterized protein YxjI
MGKLQVRVLNGEGLPHKTLHRIPDPFVLLDISGRKFSTNHVDRTCNPTWNQEFTFENIQDPTQQCLHISLFDYEKLGDNVFMGNCEPVSLATLQMNEPQKMIVHVDKKVGTITIELKALDFGVGVPCVNTPVAGGDEPRQMPDIKYDQPRTFNIRKDFFTFTGGDMDIMDEKGQPVYRVEGKWNITTDFRVHDVKTGAQLFRIGEDFFSFRKCYRVYCGDVEVAKCLKRIHPLTAHYTYERRDFVEMLDIKCDFFNIDINILRDDKKTAYIQRGLFTIRDCFQIVIEPGENILHHLCMVIIMERERERRRRKRNR